MARTFNTQPPCRAQVENQHEATVSSQCTLQVDALGLSAMAYAHGQGQVEAPLPAWDALFVAKILQMHYHLVYIYICTYIYIYIGNYENILYIKLD